MADSRSLADTQPWLGAARGYRLAEVDTVTQKRAGPRRLLWVDAVGGFLVCLGDEVVLGQAVPHAGADVPILADLSRRHAKIRREGEGYLITPLGRVRIDRREITTAAMLRDGSEIELGEGVRLRFRRPHPLSATARLDFESRHPLRPSADAVLLMAESCVLGPRLCSHVVCRHWTGDVVLFREGEKMYCRAAEAIEVDGKRCDFRAALSPSSHVTGSEFAISLEEI